MRKVQTASHWGVYYVTADDRGRITSSSPLPIDPQPSHLFEGLPELVNSELRIDRPYVRAGFLCDRYKSRSDRGKDRFVSIEWDEALSLIEFELRRVKSEFGNESIYGGSYGWASAGRLHHSPSVLKRFLGLHGGFVDRLGNHSFGAALHVMPYILGRADIPHLAMPWPLIEKHTRLLVLFGGANVKNSQINSGGAVIHDTIGWFRRTKNAGAEIINISPARDDVLAGEQTEWLAVRPNTDTALMLGLAHTLVTEDLHDQVFLDRYCAGFPIFKDYLTGRNDGRPKDAIWASSITGIPAEAIKMLARRMAKTRTLINMSWSVQRSDHGEQPVWMTVTLAAMLGQIGLPGGGFSFGLGATTGVGVALAPNIPRPTLPLGPNPVKTHVPAGRAAEMLLNAGHEFQYNGQVVRFPDIRLIYCVGGNPFHHNTNLNRFVQAWQRPEVVIVHEPFWNPAAKFADIVLPATTTLERNDIQAADMSRYYVAMRKVLDPVGQSRNDFDIFTELADRLGFGTAFSESRDEMSWLRHMYETARTVASRYSLPCFDDFWRDGLYEFPEPLECVPLLSEFRDDPVRNHLKTKSGKIEIFSNVISSFEYEDCPPHPTWIEPSEWLGSRKASRFPIHLLSNQPSTRLHSQLDPAPLSARSKILGREPLRMNTNDALARGLGNGDIVRVFNDRGAFISTVVLSDDLIEGVAQIATGAWYDPGEPGKPSLEKHGNPNVVTHDKGSSRLSQSCAAQTVLVEIEAYVAAPTVTAFVNPVSDVSSR
jgi:biotin/methionine sulfoxide reductase